MSERPNTLELAHQLQEDDPKRPFSDCVNDAVVMLRDEKAADAALLMSARDAHAEAQGVVLPGLEEPSADPCVVWMRTARGIGVDVMATAAKLSEKSPWLPYSDCTNRAAVLARDLRPAATGGHRGPVDTPELVNKRILIERGIPDKFAMNVAFHLSDRRVAIEEIDLDILRDRLAVGDEIRVALVAAMIPHERQVAMRAGRVG